MNKETVKVCELQDCNLVGWSITTVDNSLKFVCLTHYFMINA